MHDEGDAELFDQAEKRRENGILERSSAGSARDHRRAIAVLINRTLQLVAGLLRFAERQHGDGFHEAFRRPDDIILLLMEKTCQFSAGRIARRSQQSWRWSEDLALDVAALE